ncbi:MAG: biotin/lipoyl-containing protein [Thermoplasmata archaeon]
MRVALILDGRPVEIDVDLDAGRVRLDGHELPFSVVSGEGDRVELEVAGEKVIVEGWLKGLADPPRAPVAVNGEAVKVELTDRTIGPIGAVARAPPPTRAPLATSAPPPVAADAGPGVAIVPPMPGKVIEVRVAEGEMVAVGQVVLVLEAMKMRNEVTSPSAGRVTDLRVRPGANVRAKEAMLRVVPA